eukprot:917582-Amphidinium_carterae.1
MGFSLTMGRAKTLIQIASKSQQRRTIEQHSKVCACGLLAEATTCFRKFQSASSPNRQFKESMILLHLAWSSASLPIVDSLEL